MIKAYGGCKKGRTWKLSQESITLTSQFIWNFLPNGTYTIDIFKGNYLMCKWFDTNKFHFISLFCNQQKILIIENWCTFRYFLDFNSSSMFKLFKFSSHSKTYEAVGTKWDNVHQWLEYLKQSFDMVFGGWIKMWAR